jgi:hypothetical protein
MNILNGIQKFLELINDNWTTIMVILGLAIAIAKKAKNYLAKSDDEKIAIAKMQIRETILRLVAEAEMDYEEWNVAGSIKRAQVINQIYEQYPVLSKIVDQSELVAWIDKQIDDALDTLRYIIKENQDDGHVAAVCQ